MLFRSDVLSRLAGAARVYAYDLAANEVPGVQDYEERAYWRDVGTLSALAAAQQDTMGPRPRFNLWNRRWPIRGEQDAVLLARLRNRKGEPRGAATPVTPAPGWRDAGRDPRSDARLYSS